MTGGRRRVAGALALPLAIVVLAGGCGDDGEAPTAEADPTTTTLFSIETDEGTQTFRGDDEGGTFFFETDEGRSSLSFDLDGDGVVSEGASGSFSLSGRPPDGWPGDFPLPAGAEPIEGNALEAGPLTQLTTIYLVPLPAPETFAFFAEQLADPGTWSDVRDPGPATFDASLSFTGAHTGFLLVRAGGAGTEVAVQLMVES